MNGASLISAGKNLNCLIIKKKWLDLILAGKKTWEIRGCKTTIRGKIALIESGTGMIVGEAELVDVIGPLSKNDLLINTKRHRVPTESIKLGVQYAKPHAWALKNAKRYQKPKSYTHPQGAVIWVKNVA